MTISREQIAAYADGELEGDAARELERAIAADPGLQRQVEAHRRLRGQLSAHFAPLGDQPIPDRLTAPLKASVSPGNVVDFGTAVRAREERAGWKARWSRVAGPALAASLVLAVVGFGLSGRTPEGYAEGDLDTALDRQLAATQPLDAPVRILLSFRNDDGQFCRGFSTASHSGVACHDDRGWRLRQLVAGTNDRAGEYRQASSPEAEVMATIQDMAAGPALDAEGERRAIQAGW